MSKCSLYKLFAWHPGFNKYIALPGLYPYPFSKERYIFLYKEDFSLIEVPIISIPFFNKHYSNSI